VVFFTLKKYAYGTVKVMKKTVDSHKSMSFQDLHVCIFGVNPAGCYRLNVFGHLCSIPMSQWLQEISHYDLNI